MGIQPPSCHVWAFHCYHWLLSSYTCYTNPRFFIFAGLKTPGCPSTPVENFSAHLQGYLFPRFSWTSPSPSKPSCNSIAFAFACSYSTVHLECPFGHLVSPPSQSGSEIIEDPDSLVPFSESLPHAIKCTMLDPHQQTTPPSLPTKHLFYLGRLPRNSDWSQTIIKIILFPTICFLFPWQLLGVWKGLRKFPPWKKFICPFSLFFPLPCLLWKVVFGAVATIMGLRGDSLKIKANTDNGRAERQKGPGSPLALSSYYIRTRPTGQLCFTPSLWLLFGAKNNAM